MKVNLDIEGGENKYLETELRGFLGWEYNFGVFLYERPWEALGLSLVPALLQATVYKFVSQNVQNRKKKNAEKSLVKIKIARFYRSIVGKMLHSLSTYRRVEI